MRSIAVTLGALCALAAAGALAQTSGLRRASELDWKPAPADLPRGAEVAVLSGDPAASGPFIIRLRAPGGYQVPAHKHNDLETVTVLTGVLRFGEGANLDPRSEKFLHAGDFVAIAPGMGHWVAVNEDATVQISGVGPWKVNYLDPRDDPQRQKGASSLR